MLFVCLFKFAQNEFLLSKKSVSFSLFIETPSTNVKRVSETSNSNCQKASVALSFIFPDTKYLLSGFSMVREPRIQLQNLLVGLLHALCTLLAMATI